ncbi:hypothetical protein AB0L88_01385 [Saccharopolyspora shandongensis]|uniref:hypothetical protein n=1 Tax=Saccharopolyspora shandongensis TaxID=418495 RepID=UPI00343B7C21
MFSLDTTENRPPVVVDLPVGFRGTRERVYSPTVVDPTAAPGLVIAPANNMAYHVRWGFTGEWALLHVGSGLPAIGAIWGAGLGHVREAASLLADTGIDWTASRDALGATPRVRELAIRVHEQVSDAVRQARPVRLRESSWHLVPPGWLALVVEPGGEKWACAALTTYTDAENLVIRHGVGDVLPGYDLEICRESEPNWALRCARQHCRNELLDDEEYGPLQDTDRREIEAEAREQGWRHLDDRRLLCPDCSHQFQPTRPVLDRY